MAEPTCLTCEFFRNAQVMGSCRRYPAPQNKHQNDWCGEYQMKIMLALPVYDIMTDTTTTPERKKPGRKPKNGDNAPT